MAKKGKYYTRPDGLKEAIRTINGKRVAFRGKTDREVEQKMREYKEKQERGVMFAAAANEWIIEKESLVGESTRCFYAKEVKRAIEYFDCPIKQIKPIDIRRYIAKIAKEGYAAQTGKQILSILRQIFSRAVMEGYIDISPVTEVKMPKGMPKTKRQALTEEQEYIVKKSGIERTAHFWLFAYLLLYTGMRRGEAAALTYADIDRKNMVIHVNKKVNYSFYPPKLENFLKSENGERDIPLLPPLADALPKNAIGLIFAGEDGGYMRMHDIINSWRRYCRDVGLVDDSGDKLEYPITPHCLRHSYATICFEAGLDPRSAAKFLGDDVATVESVYTHLRAEKRESAAEKLIKHFAVM